MALDSQSDTGIELQRKLAIIERKIDDMTSRGAVLLSGDPHFGAHGPADDEIDLREIWYVIWRAKWIIVCITLIFFVISALYAKSLSNIYRSEALMVPAEEESSRGLASLASQFGGLANLAGVNLDGKRVDRMALALEVLRSRSFVSHVIQKHNLLVPLMAAKGWNRESNQLIIDPKIYDSERGLWVRKVSPPKSIEPTALEAYEEFIERMSIVQDKKTNFVSVGVEFYSPFLAKQWVDILIEEVNAVIKEREVNEAEKSIEYLKEQIEKTSIAGMQAVFYGLIEEQTKTIMFAEVRNEYVFKIIDKAVVPEEKFKPKRLLICALGTALGGIIALCWVFIRYLFTFFKSNRDDK